jgi:periplasmic protein TonB
MESKKTKEADVHKKSLFFFSIGLFVSTSTMVAIFEHKTYVETVDFSVTRVQDQMEEMLDVPTTDQPPPPPPQIQQPKVIEVPDEEKMEEEIMMNLDVESTTETNVERIEISQEKEEDIDQIFTVVEQTASPIGGTTAFFQFVSDNMKYPPQAKRMGVSGRVFCEFVVNRDGTIQDVKITRGIGAGCDEEAIRVMQGAPPWMPAKQRGKEVRSRIHMPLVFKLD